MTALERYIVEEVKKKRLELHITQADLSMLMGKSDHYVSQVENGRNGNKYNINHLNRLANIFHCSIKDFLPDGPFPDESRTKDPS